MRIVVKEKLLRNIPNQQPAVKMLGHNRLAISKECVEAVEKLWFQWKEKLSCFNLES